MKLLKVDEIKHVIAGTNRGNFTMVLSKGGTSKDYRFVLDSVPVDPTTNKQLRDIFNGVLFTL